MLHTVCYLELKVPLKRLPQDRLEGESFSFLENFFNEHNWEFARQARDKSGIDAELEVVSGVKRSGKFLKCQIKAGRSYVSSESEDEIRIRVQRKYLEHWRDGNFSVLLFYYDPTSKRAWWKAIREYLKAEPGTLRGVSKDCIVRLRKEEDLLVPESLASLGLVADHKFDYMKIACEPSQTEVMWSNWFEVKSFPREVWYAPTIYMARGTIAPSLKGLFAFTVNAEMLFSFLDLSSADCELREYCKSGEARPIPIEQVDKNILKELLNRTIDVFGRLKGLVGPRNRLYFPPDVLKDQASNVYPYVSLKGRQEVRTKIYIQRSDGVTEYKHHAVGLSFVEHERRWYMQIDPEWYFTYPYLRQISPREIGARITSEKADTQNKEFLYLLHFWRQYLSSGSESIVMQCSSVSGSPRIVVDSRPVPFVANFRLFNDYFGERGVRLEES
jgi:hypothetical protein